MCVLQDFAELLAPVNTPPTSRLILAYGTGDFALWASSVVFGTSMPIRRVCSRACTHPQIPRRPKRCDAGVANLVIWN